MSKHLVGRASRQAAGDPDCEECGGKGFVPPGMKAVRPCGCRSMAKTLEEMCHDLAEKVKRIQPDWAENIERTRDERHWTYTQLLSACMAYVYERGLHMTIPKHDFWNEGEAPPEVVRCAWRDCGKEFKRAFPGEKFCSQICGQLAMAPKKMVQVEVLAPPTHDDLVPFPSNDVHDQLADG